MLLMITMSIVKETECKGGIRGRAEVIYSIYQRGYNPLSNYFPFSGGIRPLLESTCFGHS